MTQGRSQIDRAARLRLLQAVHHVLTEKRPDRAEIQKLRDYARTEIADSAGMDNDEVATAIALQLMNVSREEISRLRD